MGGDEVATVRTPIAARRWSVIVTAMVTAGVLLGSCSNGAAPSGAKDSSKAKVDPPAAESYPASVAVYGDSLAMQARPYFKLLMAAADQSSTTYYSSFVGTAICDWLPRMRQLAVTTHFEAVVLEFSGNALTPCMAGIADYTPAYYAKYRADTMTAISIWVPTVAHVFLVGSPLTRAQQASLAPVRWSRACRPTWSAPRTGCTSVPWPRWTNHAVSTPREPSGSPMPWCARSPLPSSSP